ncbi:MAG: ester cyclase [Pseudonocardia sp.]|nr:ester cyclase [Pseudonocardia sp.]
MLDAVHNSDDTKRIIQAMITTVWAQGDLDALGRYWTEDSRNHADPTGRTGLTALRTYHEDFAAQLVGFSDPRIEIIQQVGECDRMATHLLTRGRHTGTFAGITPTGREVN